MMGEDKGVNTTANQGEPVVAYCRTCGKPLSESAKHEVYGVIYCEDCLAARVHGTMAAAPVAGVVPGSVAYVPSAPNPALAFILGWIPGVGAMYNGQVAKGFVHVGIFALIISILNAGANGFEPFFGIGLAAFYLYMVFDAYQTARALRYGQPVPDYLRILSGLHSMGLRSEAGAAYVAVAPAAAATPPTYDPQAPVVAYVPPVAVTPDPRPEHVPVSALILIGLGVLFLLSTLGIFNLQGRFFFPLLLIAIGVWVAIRRFSGERGC